MLCVIYTLCNSKRDTLTTIYYLTQYYTSNIKIFSLKSLFLLQLTLTIFEVNWYCQYCYREFAFSFNLNTKKRFMRRDTPTFHLPTYILYAIYMCSEITACDRHTQFVHHHALHRFRSKHLKPNTIFTWQHTLGLFPTSTLSSIRLIYLANNCDKCDDIHTAQTNQHNY